MAQSTAAGKAQALNRRRTPHGASGFTYLGVLFAVAFLGIALAAVGTVWATAAQRDRETELLWVGEAYRNAIASYYLHGPGVHQYPQELQELIEDHRFPSAYRHLRRLYADPITGQVNWELMRDANGGIMGVHSSSHMAPIKRANFPRAESDFEGMECYCDWRFAYLPRHR